MLCYVCAELQILDASYVVSSSELRLQRVNGTFADLTLRCVGEGKSAPQWRHDDVAVSNGTDADTTVHQRQYVDADRRHNSLTMTRRNVTQRFAGRYQCVDTAYFQSDSDVLIIHAAARAIYPRMSVNQSFHGYLDLPTVARQQELL